MSHTATIQSVTLPILGENPDAWSEGFKHAADWATKMQHIRKAYPELEQRMTPYVLQCTAPGALKTLNALITGKGLDAVSDDYDHEDAPDMHPPEINAENIQRLAEYHDAWFALIIESCAESEQLQLVRQIEMIPFPKPTSGAGRYTSAQITPYIARLHQLFERFTPEQREKLEESKEVREAVYRQLPLQIRNLLKNQREHAEDDFEDTWASICRALAKNVHQAELYYPIGDAFTVKEHAMKENTDVRPAKRPKLAQPSDPSAEDARMQAVRVLARKDDPSRDEVVKNITCMDCSKTFPFTKGEQSFYITKKLDDPKRCKECRSNNARKKERRI